MRGTKDELMSRGLKLLAISAALTVGQVGTSLAQYAACPAGYTYYGGACQPNGYSNPVTGAGNGMAAGAAAGSAAAGPVGGIVGGALGIAGGTVAGTTNAVTGTVNTVTGAPAAAAPACAAGYMMYSDGLCYPAPR
jgi:hypothetical protein